jgi:hypothetical protein
VRWLGLADNTERVPKTLIAESMRDRNGKWLVIAD